MPELKKIIMIHCLAKEFDDLTVKERLEEIIKALGAGAYNATPEITTLKEAAKIIESYVESGIRTMNFLMNPSGTIPQEKGTWKKSGKRLSGTAAVVEAALYSVGLEIVLLYNKEQDVYVLVAIL